MREWVVDREASRVWRRDWIDALPMAGHEPKPNIDRQSQHLMVRESLRQFPQFIAGHAISLNFIWTMPSKAVGELRSLSPIDSPGFAYMRSSGIGSYR